MTTSDGQAERRALIDLARSVEPADASVGRLVERLGPVEVVGRIRGGGTGLRHEEGLRARLEMADRVPPHEQAASVGARIVTRGQVEWPSQLGAYGIDAAAHRGALAVGAPTVCVLAGGVDVPYPRAHDAMIARIADEGLVVSETPPGEPVRRQRFLSRNRIIASLTRATLVVEAAERSGTTATAHAAQIMNRPVMAVPGPVTSPVSAGCHRMIGDGEAMLVTSAEEVLRMLDFGRPDAVPASTSTMERERDRLSEREQRVLDAFPARGGVDPDDLRARAGLAAGQVWAALGILESTGWVASAAGQWRLVRR